MNSKSEQNFFKLVDKLTADYNRLVDEYHKSLEKQYNLESENIILKQENINLFAENKALKLGKLNEYTLAEPEHLYELECGIKERTMLKNILEEKEKTIDNLQALLRETNKSIEEYKYHLEFINTINNDDEFKPPKDIYTLTINTNFNENINEPMDCSNDSWSIETEYDSEYSVDDYYDDRYSDSP
jgi:hypothetical protein